MELTWRQNWYGNLEFNKRFLFKRYKTRLLGDMCPSLKEFCSFFYLSLDGSVQCFFISPLSQLLSSATPPFSLWLSSTMKSLYLCSSLSTMNHSASLSVALLDDEKLLSLSRWLSSAKNHSTSLSIKLCYFV